MTRRLGTIAAGIWLPLLLLAYWWWATKGGSSPFYPPLTEIWEAFERNWLFDRVDSDLKPSLLLFVGGYLIAAFLGIALGTLLGMWSLGRRATVPIVDFLRSVPAPAVISILIVLLGFGYQMKLTVIAFTALFPVLLNTIDGVRGVNRELLDLATVYQLRLRDRIFRVMLPAASPQIFAGLRVSLAIALAVLVFAEMMAGTNGLGFFIFEAQATYQIPNMWSGIVLLGLIGYAVNLIFLFLEGRIMRWHRGWRAQERNSTR